MDDLWEETQGELLSEMRKAKKNFESKRNEIEVKEEKINFYEQNYTNLITEFKKEAQDRENLIQEYQSMEKELTREELSEMILGIKKRAKENSKTSQKKIMEISKIKQELDDLNDELKVKNLQIITKAKDGEDKKKKKDTSFDDLKNVFKDLIDTFDKTKSYMEKYIGMKLENKQFEDKVIKLKQNKYKEITQRLVEELAFLEE